MPYQNIGCHAALTTGGASKDLRGVASGIRK